MWETKGIAGTDAQNCPYYGAHANSEFNAISGCSAVPTEQGGGSGTRCGHWSDACLRSELMTGYLSSGLNPLSRITIGSLQDLGYQVDYSTADSFVRADLSPSCTCSRRSLNDMEHGATHQLGLDNPNTVRRVLSTNAHLIALKYGQSILKKKNMSSNVPRDDNGVTYVGDKVTSVFVHDGGGIFSVVVKR